MRSGLPIVGLIGILLLSCPGQATEKSVLADSLSAILSEFPPTALLTNLPTAEARRDTNTAINPALRESWNRLATTNLMDGPAKPVVPDVSEFEEKLEIARRQRLSRQGAAALPGLISILRSGAPDALKRTALLELALVAQDENQPAKALQIFAQYLDRWPDDPGTPEILLRQGLIYRQIGLNKMAMTKFYAVMSSALVLKADQFDYYRRLVIQAQTEIAETYYQQGQHQEAVQFLTRLLKADHPALNRAQIHFKLIRSLARLDRHDEVVAQGRLFLEQHEDAPELAEVRFHMALSSRALGSPGESLQQVLQLLQEQQRMAATQPQVWAYWRQRVGNEIANQFYREGNYAEALTVYERLATIDPSPDWQVPVWYQIGVSYEKLSQPARALQAYADILAREREAGSNASPQLKTVFDMARWRQEFLRWQSKTESHTERLKPAALLMPTNSPPAMAATTES